MLDELRLLSRFKREMLTKQPENFADCSPNIGPDSLQANSVPCLTRLTVDARTHNKEETEKAERQSSKRNGFRGLLTPGPGALGNRRLPTVEAA